MIHTTSVLAKKEEACQKRYRKMAKALGGVRNYGKDTPVPLTKVLEVCGLEDTLWTLRCCIEKNEAKHISQVFACDCAEHVVHIYEKSYPNDNRPRRCIEVARNFIDGKATSQELAAAWDAARDAAEAARAAAWDTEREWQKGKFLEYLEG